MINKPTTSEERSRALLESHQRLSDSLLWKIQRQFFLAQGIQAWNTGKVPHYATSNPFIAHAYGEVITGFLRDCLVGRMGSIDTSEPIYIFELGTGSGRFSYHFLKHFFEQVPSDLLSQLSVKYVMTDFAPENVQFWLSHESMQPFVDLGVLDFAQLDVQSDEVIKLIHSGTELSLQTLKNPAVLIANYFFDSLPQDLFSIRAGNLYETGVALYSESSEPDFQQSEVIENLEIAFEDRQIESDYYEEAGFNHVLSDYQQQLTETALLFPVAGLRGLNNLRRLTNDRLLLLSADKGYARSDLLEGREKPNLAFHQGCFSLMVNYHAIAQCVLQQGGQAFTPEHLARSITVCAFLFGQGEQDCVETISAYERAICSKGPDNFFALKKTIEPNYCTLTLKHALGYLRFSGWDFNIFLGCWPRLMSLVETASECWLDELEVAIHHVWERYFFIGEDRNLAAHLATLLKKMGRESAAKIYVEHSLRLYGECSDIVDFGVDRRVNPETSSNTSLPLDAAYSETNLLTLHLAQLRQRLEAYLQNERREFSSLPEIPAIVRLGEIFELSTFEKSLLLMCAAVELEPNFQGLLAAAQGGRQIGGNKPYPTLALALAILPDADWSILSAQSPVRYWNLIQLGEARSLTQCPLQIDRRILCYLLGTPAIDEHLAELLTSVLQQSPSEALPPSYQRYVEQMVNAWQMPDPSQGYPIVCLSGVDSAAKSQLAALACDHLGISLQSISVAALPTAASELKQFQQLWEREALLSDAALLIDCDGTYPADAGRETAIALLLESLSTPVLLSSNDKKPVLRRAVITVELPSLTYAEQTDLWQTSLGESAALPNGHVNGLATQFNLSPTAIRTACHQLRVSEPETGEEAASTLWHLCRAQARPNLDDLAQRIDAKATWEDLVLPDRQQAVLSDIATHLKQRSRVYQDWGFASKGDRGLGISALFYGESGTGKTMAAEVLANGCQLDLYRIDLSSVVSKYIGETEKNLRRIFDAAETGGAILLFDEADALFGKRSEVKDSRDRHANIEVSYLLQRMEAYQGLAILTSNLKDSIDKAFARRIRFMVQFPSPERAARAEIWRRIFPKAAPVRNLNYEKLGQLKIAGGNIRSIALSTAFIAAEEGAAIEMRHVYKAAQREYMKLERLLTTEETRDWEI